MLLPDAEARELQYQRMSKQLSGYWGQLKDHGADTSDIELAACLWADFVEAYVSLQSHVGSLASSDARIDLDEDLVDFEVDLQHLIWHHEALTQFLRVLGLWELDRTEWKPKGTPRLWWRRLRILLVKHVPLARDLYRSVSARVTSSSNGDC